MTWNPWLIGLNVATDAAVALSYYSIPAALCYIVWNRRLTLKLEPILLLFACFIALCGAGHLIDIVSIWKPVYWFKGFWNLGTATASVATAIVLIPRTFDFINMPGRAQRLEREASELRAHSGLLGTVIDSVDEAILLVSPAGEVLLRNRAAQAMLPEDETEWRANVDPEPAVWNSPDGRQIERFSREASGYGQLYVFRDVTEKLRSEQARLRLEQIIETMKQGFEVISLPSERIIQTNPGFERMHRAPRNGMLGRPVEAVLIRPSGSPERVLKTVLEECEREQFWEGETQHATETGEPLWCSSRFNLHEEGGERFLSAIHHDITGQKRIAAESMRVESRLREAAKLESLGVLAGGVAHDFNNLLVGILGNASLAIEIVGEENPARSMLRDVIAASESAASLTRQLLAYAGKGRFVIELIDLTELVTRINALVQTSIPRKVQVRLELPRDLPHIEADVSQIQQLVMNLVINAAEAISDQTGTVLVTTAVQEVDEHYINSVLAPEQISPGTYVALEVHDTGVGMNEDTLGKIFDPFFTTKFTGRGLGLAAVLGIIRGHKGALKVYSTLGKGTTFKVLLPASEKRKMEVRAERTLTSRPEAGAVLVIDDEEFVRRTAKSMLEAFGYTVYTAKDGREGVERFRALRDEVSLILLDMTMPVMSGKETFRELTGIESNTPVILSSGHNESEAIQGFTGKGLAAFIQKPYSAAELIEKVRAAIAEWGIRASKA